MLNYMQLASELALLWDSSVSYLYLFATTLFNTAGLSNLSTLTKLVRN